MTFILKKIQVCRYHIHKELNHLTVTAISLYMCPYLTVQVLISLTTSSFYDSLLLCFTFSTL